MKFSHPYLLFLLWAVLPVLGILIYGIYRHKKIIARFAHSSVYPYILPNFSYARKWIKAILVCLALCMALVALAGPKAGFRWEKTTLKGVDIMIALDCSASMLAQDVSPTRLTRAKREIIDLTRLLHSDRAGLVAFAGKAVLQCPLTLDYQAFHIFIDALSPDYLPVGGTNLTAALTSCYKGFDPESDTEKAIILITDGEDTAGNDSALTQQIQTLVKENIRVFAIGVGDPAGAPIPQKNGGFKKDGQGNIILSRVDEVVLKKITSMTRGRYVRSVAGDMDLDLIYSQDILNTMERKQLTQGKKKVWEHRFQWLLLPAIVFFLLELMLRDTPASGKGEKDPRMLLTLVLMVTAAGLFGPSPARAGLFSSSVKQGMEAYEKKDFHQAQKAFIDAQLEAPDDLRLYYNIGTAAYGAGEYDLAQTNFSQAAQTKDMALKQKAMYNLANTRYRQGNLAQAVKDYEALLKEFPQDVQAKENLAFVKQKQKENEKKNKQDPEEKNKQDKKEQDQKKQNQDQKNQGSNKDKNQNSEKSSSEKKEKSDPGPEKEDQKKDGQGSRPPEPQPDKEDEEKEPVSASFDKEKGQAGSAEPAEGQKPDAGAKLLENRLNRLEDKPGMALMPQGGSPQNGKNW